MATTDAAPTFRAAEDARIDRRRVALAFSPAEPRRALALSGGGIRSATFALGVLQALARKPLRVEPTQEATTTSAANAGGASAGPPKAPDWRSLLTSFDYLSTVSGGGYIGSFFCSLFVPGRLDGEPPPPTTDPSTPASQASVAAARRAYDVMTYEPPGRIHATDDFTTGPPGRGPLAWLRENGRYLTPTGAGDLLYASALAIRNWLAVHYVIGTLLVFVLSALALARCAVAFVDPFGDYEAALLPALDGGYAWWSPLWWLPLATLLLLATPFGVAFWLTHPRSGGTVRDPPRPLTLASGAALVLALMLAAAAIAVSWPDPIHTIFASETDIHGAVHWQNPAALVAAFTSASTLLACAFFILSQIGVKSIASHRVVLTRQLSQAVQWTLALSLIALIDTLGQTAYLWLIEGGVKTLVPVSSLAALTWIIRHVALLLDERSKPGWLAKIPLGIAAMVLGALLITLTAVIWALLVHWLQWQGLRPDEGMIVDSTRRAILIGLTIVSFVLAWTAGRFPGFVNLSTLQALYGARLTRAYLGASNGRRFASGSQGEHIRSVAEPDERDDLTHEQYYDGGVLAPLHIVNVTINQTSDPAEQLTQRDRKGHPIAILPSGFAIEGAYSPLPHHRVGGELDQRLTIGQWIGTSGAAFTTGLGRATNLGMSLVLGLANVRLGMWWRSGCGVDLASGFDRLFETVFRSQAFLMQELTAQFHGLRRTWQYLSDGGHFENTAVYELLRPERGVTLIVACDDGCDERYAFDDVANLTRLARIDFGIEIEVDTVAPADPAPDNVFGTPEQLADREHPFARCALLLNVYDTRPARTAEPRCRIVVIKPRVVAALSIDVGNYAHAHPRFPQEPTSDQFFDEAQWEAYRKLGMELATRVIDYCRRNPGLRLI